MTAAARPVPVSSLRDLPVMARFKSPKLARSLAPHLKARGAAAAPIRVGRAGGVLYPVNDFESVEALRMAGIENVMALVAEYDGMGALLADHVESNFHPHTVDPLMIRLVVGYMAESYGMSDDDACKALMLDIRPDLAGSIRAPLTDAARDVLIDMTGQIAARVHNATTPVYYVTKVAKLDPERQVGAATDLSSYTLPHLKADGMASWPEPGAVDSVLAGIPRARKKVPAKERVSVPGEVGDLTKKRTRKDKEEGAKAAKKAADYIGPDSSLVYVPTKGKQPDLIFNTKTGRAAKAKETGGTYTMTDDLGRPTYALGASVAKYLGVDSADSGKSLTLARYPSISKAREALAGAKDPGTRCVVISTCPLPRR